MQMMLGFFLTNPVKSLVFLENWLERFSHASGYTVNDQKYIMWGFSVSSQIRSEISGISTAQWSTHGVKFLGIILSHDLS